MSVSLDELTLKYQKKLNDVQTLLATIPVDLKEPFRKAVNIYDIVRKEQEADYYIAYGLKALALMGWYYDVLTESWKNAGVALLTEEQIRDAYTDAFFNKYDFGAWRIADARITLEELNAVGEMQSEMLDIDLHIIGGEQDTGEVKVPNIPISIKADVDEMTKGDKSIDKFIYAYSDSGVSKNKRNWRPVIMDSIARQVMELMPPGHYGHMKPEDIGYVMPPPVITWFGAMTERLSDDANRLWLKGYIIPLEEGNNLKTYIRTKAVDSISVWGGLTLLPNEETGVADVLDIDLKSIDISGKLKEGLHSGIVKLAGEMEEKNNVPTNTGSGEQNKKGGNQSMDRLEVIKGLTADEIRSHNPVLFEGLKQGVLDSINVDAKNRALLTAAGEMETVEQAVGAKGADAVKAVQTYKSFVGEMEAVLGMETNSATIPSLSEITTKVKGFVEKSGIVDKLSAIIKPDAGQDVVQKAEAMVATERVAKNTQNIETVKAKFAELTADISNDVIRDMIGDNFASILEAKPDAISDDFLETAINTMTTQMPNVKEKVIGRAKSLFETGHAAGEMTIFDNIGVGQGASAGAQDTSKMSDKDFAKSLGYGEK